ncbi:MAG: hypothetical protein ACFFAN_13565 [Promethearchaeota archaeon]
MIYLKAPMELKKITLTFLIGTLLSGVVGVFVYIFTELLLPIAIGILLMAISFAKEPKIIHILLFKAYRLIVFHNNTGLSAYEYKWSETEIEKHLIAGLLQAVRQMGIFVLELGEVSEIKLSQGTLILHRSRNITTGLVTSKTSLYLNECIKKFSEAFEKKFETNLNSSHTYLNESDFNSGGDLIDEFFTYVP